MACPIRGGFLVAIEGIDGSGKTTQAFHLANFCDERRLDCVMSKEPTQGKYGQQIRDSAIRGRLSVKEEIEILDNDRREHVENVINPGLRADKIVILDRYYFSTAAYQGAHGADADWILAENERFAPQPDLLVVLDLPPETGIGRIRKRGDEPNKFETMESLEQARSIFTHIQRPYKLQIDGRKSIERIWSRIRKEFIIGAMNKISASGVSEEALNRTLELFGEDSLPLRATA